MRVEGVFRAAKQHRDFVKGAVIFSEGDAGQEMFGIVDGSVSLRSSHGRVAELGPDDVFGEMAIIDGSARMATAVAATDCRLAVIDRREFLFLTGETPNFALQVMGLMARRLRDHGH